MQECKANQHAAMKDKTDLHKSLGKAKVQALHLQLYGIKNGVSLVISLRLYHASPRSPPLPRPPLASHSL